METLIAALAAASVFRCQNLFLSSEIRLLKNADNVQMLFLQCLYSRCRENSWRWMWRTSPSFSTAQSVAFVSGFEASWAITSWRFFLVDNDVCHFLRPGIGLREGVRCPFSMDAFPLWCVPKLEMAGLHELSMVHIKSYYLLLESSNTFLLLIWERFRLMYLVSLFVL